jgi:hypothetical protein
MNALARDLGPWTTDHGLIGGEARTVCEAAGGASHVDSMNDSDRRERLGNLRLQIFNYQFSMSARPLVGG